MNNTAYSLRKKWPLLAVALLVIAMTLSCQVFSGPAAKTTQPGGPIDLSGAGTPSQPEKLPTAVQGENQSKQAPGTINLAKLDAGLEQYGSYHQRLTAAMQGTYQGKPYDYTETVERDVNQQDSASLITTTGDQAVYLFTARLGGVAYTQQKAEAPCRSSEKEIPQDRNPALKLPFVKGAEKVGDDAPDGNGTATHIRFDERSLPMAGKAQGEAWIAENGAVLKYTLTVQISEGDFKGTRSWEYELSQVDAGRAITLPAPCQPVLADVPTLPNAAGLLRKPGFIRYTSKSTVEQARQFYVEQLADWTPLPGAKAQPGDPPLPDTWALAFARPNDDGTGRLLIIQLTAKDGALTVIAQSVTTKKPVQVDPATGAVTIPEGGTGSPETPPEESAGPTLPADFPEYPGAMAMANKPQMIMLLTSDPPDKVLEFYKSILDVSGWKLEKENTTQATTIQEWSKENAKVMVAINTQGSQTQIIMTAMK